MSEELGPFNADKEDEEALQEILDEGV